MSFEGIEVIWGDITKMQVDAIVNAANKRLLGGGGVDGAIHRAAGEQLREACKVFPEIRTDVRCETGDVKVTDGYLLPAQYVIHTVGPVWHGGLQNEAELLKSCYQKSLQVAVELGVSSIAFPAISTGVYGYPIESGLRIALQAMYDISTTSSLNRIVLVCFRESDFHQAQSILLDIRSSSNLSVS